MHLLLDDSLAPITSQIGFLEATSEACAQAFMEWAGPIQKARGVILKRHQVTGNLESILKSLLPLTSHEARRFLFIPTLSQWTAYFDNSRNGPDVPATIPYLCRVLKCRGVRVAAIPHEPKASRARYGAIIFELYGPEITTLHNTTRSISLVNDGGRWRFDEVGEPLPFENTERYAARNKHDRFSFDELQRYLEEIALRPFDETFYLPPGSDSACLVVKHGKAATGMKEFMLQDI